MRVLLFVAIAALAAGCKRHPAGEASCNQVGARFYELAHAKVAAAGLAAAERDGVTGLLAPMRDSMVRACRDDGWSAEARACFVGATEQPQYFACDVKLSAEQRAKLSRAAARQ